MQSALRLLTDRFLTYLCIALACVAFLHSGVPRSFAYNTYVRDRYDKVSDPRAGAVATHAIGFTYTNLTVPIGSLKFEFCTNSPFVETPCTAPTGFDASSANLTSQSGVTGYSIVSSSFSNEIILSRAAALPSGTPASYTLDGVKNPTDEGTYFVRIATYTATDASGAAVEAGGVAVSVNGPLVLSSEVPPYLTFCAGVTIDGFDCSTANSFYIDLGELSKTSTKKASSQIMAATNAAYGYSIFASGTTFTSGNNTIPAPNAPTPSAIGTSQFGINLRLNTNPSVGEEPIGPGTASVTSGYSAPNRFMYIPGDSIVTASSSQDSRKYTISYVVNVANAQPAGIYATTLTYICLANF